MSKHGTVFNGMGPEKVVLLTDPIEAEFDQWLEGGKLFSRGRKMP